jgi:hypothetical protein
MGRLSCQCRTLYFPFLGGENMCSHFSEDIFDFAILRLICRTTNTAHFSRSLRRPTRWCSVISVTSAYTRWAVNLWYPPLFRIRIRNPNPDPGSRCFQTTLRILSGFGPDPDPTCQPRPGRIRITLCKIYQPISLLLNSVCRIAFSSLKSMNFF